jgi:hypothetical protein
MHFLASVWTLLAARVDTHRVWGRFDHEEPGFSTNHLVVLVGIVLVLGIIAVVKRILERRATRTFTSDSSTKLFHELCAAHGLRRAARKLLKRLAEARGLKNAATLFVEPQYFDAGTLPMEWQSHASELRRLSLRLFG